MEHQPGITVHGTGRITARPDTATVILGVESLQRSAGDAQAAGSRQMQSVLGALRDLVIADDDLSTQSVSLEAQYDYSGPQPRPTGYLASQTLLVRVRRIDQLGPVIDVAIGGGATRVNGVSFSVAEPGEAMRRARALAVGDARSRAETLAEAAGVTVGRAVSIVEGPPAHDPGPMPFARMAMMEKADTPVATGTTEISVDVEVTFAIGG